MEQLTIGELEKDIKKLKMMFPKKYKEIKIFIGDDDDELNGVHRAWHSGELIKNTTDEDNKELYNFVNECNRCETEDPIIFLIS